jgi:hypothetical protein
LLSVALSAFAATDVFVKAQDEAAEKKLKKEKEQEANAIKYYADKTANGTATTTDEYNLQAYRAEAKRKSERGFWGRAKDEFNQYAGEKEQELKNGGVADKGKAILALGVWNPVRALIRAAGNESDKADYQNMLNIQGASAGPWDPKVQGQAAPDLGATIGAEVNKAISEKFSAELNVRITNPEAIKMGPPPPQGPMFDRYNDGPGGLCPTN